MAGLQAILKDTPARREAEPRQARDETAQIPASPDRKLQRLEARQTQAEQNLRQLSALAESLFRDLRRCCSA